MIYLGIILNTHAHLCLVLARTTQPIEPQPPQSQASSIQRNIFNDDDELERESDTPVPRFSIPIDEEDEEESFQLAPPRLSLPLEADFDAERSVEIARRASGAPLAERLSRGSFGDIRFSDRFAETTSRIVETIVENPNGSGDFLSTNDEDELGYIDALLAPELVLTAPHMGQER